ncbi:SGNH hydrolase [Serendipita vermifera]|nr:SGNH hydrolase [Serendipita vermifera]
MSLVPVVDNIVLFGDSLTQFAWQTGGLAQLLADSYSRKMDVINRAFEQVFAKKGQGDQDRRGQKTKLMTIWLGANDACLPEGYSRQHIPLPQYKENLKWMVNAIRSPTSPYHSPSTRLILITPPPIHEPTWIANLAARVPPREMNRSWSYTKLYVDAMLEVGKELDVPVVDAFDVIWKAAGEQTEALTMFLSDGVHLTKEGYEVVYNELIAAISRNYPELQHDKLTEAFTSKDDVDPDDPRGTVVLRYVDV